MHILWHSSWMEYKSIFICHLLTSVKFSAPVVIHKLSQTWFKLSALSPENALAFHSRSCNIRYKKPNTNQGKPLTINQTVWKCQAQCNKTTRNTVVVSDSQQCLSIQQYNSMYRSIQKLHIPIWVPFLLSVLAITHCDPTQSTQFVCVCLVSTFGGK